MLRKVILTCLIIAAGVLIVIGYLYSQGQKQQVKPADLTPVEATWWDFQSIDTMKYSRDLAREKVKDLAFDQVIDNQVKSIAQTGASHVAIATPYDTEFLSYLKRWEAAARRYNLNVWYRGNWSGWEGWFEYKKITREEHIQKTVQFIKDNPGLFKSGDIFSACPECENGGPGDPRLNGDAEGHRQFLIDEYKAVSEIFRNMGKNVKSNYSPMNGDIAKIIMDADTTKALGGVVVIDHYVKDANELAQDIGDLARVSTGKVVLGEFGAPIPDIHGNLTEQEQAQWLEKTLDTIAKVDSLTGVNYWVNSGGSTRIWNDDGTPRQAVQILKSYFSPQVVEVSVYDEINKPVTTAKISYKTKYIKPNLQNKYVIKDNLLDEEAIVYANGYEQKNLLLDASHPKLTVVLVKNNESIFFKLRKFLYSQFNI